MTEVADNTLVDERYRIINRVGSGGMADVYCAEDTHLGRQVALKVLHRRFAQDQEFVERFRREASSAAGLQHPHIVGVFDRGEHEGTYYIAMEYLSGRTLKQVVGAEAPLDQLRTIDIGTQILEAAAFAHRRGVIHRDFKPQNVIVAEDDTAKVTDFGIARLGASEITETGSVMGTAQYISPEQAQGQPVSERSDIYSIGVVLYEMLAGRQPFSGDTAVSVALLHLNEPPPPLSGDRPDIHPALEAAVMRALAKDPAQRYGGAEQFAAALQAARARIESGDDGGEDTAVFAPVPVPGYEAEQDAALAEAVPAMQAGEPPPGEPPGAGAGRRRWPWLAAALVGLGGLIALAVAIAVGPERLPVPDVVGKPRIEAETVMERLGFEVKLERVRDARPVDQVVKQDPPAGSRADKGSTIELTVSAGPGEAIVPSVEGLTQKRAVKELNEAGFRVTVDTAASRRVRERLAIRTVPRGGERAPLTERVRLFISSGPRRVQVPSVVGATRSSAEARLESVGLVAVIEEREAPQPDREVIAQNPVGGTEVSEGDRVTLTVSTGPREPDRVNVPDVVGLSLDAARSDLRAAGFQVDVRRVRVESEDQDGVVIRQSPRAGTTRTVGRTVAIVVGRFEAPPDEEVTLGE